MSALTDSITADYLDAIAEVGDDVIFRRYVGTGDARTNTDYTVRAAVSSEWGSPAERLAGSLPERRRRIIALYADFVDVSFPLPLVMTDKVVVNGVELSMLSLDESTREISGVRFAYDILAKG